MREQHVTEEAEAKPGRLTLTVDEVAGLLGVSRSTAYECIRTGEIPSVTFGRRILVPKRWLDSLLNCEPG
ncbi:MAG: helix-turn-helix domain-containing protein [Actinomycetota bacterium]